LGQGKEKAVEFLAQNPELLAAMREKTLAALELGKKTHRATSDTTSEQDGDA